MNILEDAINERKKKALEITLLIPADGEGEIEIKQTKEAEEPEEGEDLEENDNGDEEKKQNEKLDQPPGLKSDEELLVGDNKADLLRKKKNGRGPNGLMERAMMSVLDKD